MSLLCVINLTGCDHKERNVKYPFSISHNLDNPIEFAEGKIKTNNGICFSSNGTTLYTSNQIEKRFHGGKRYMGIFKHIYENSSWQEPELVDFGIDIDAYHPVLSPDNKTLYFNSRSHPNSVNIEIPHNIWHSSKTISGWSAPKIMEVINSPNYDSYPSISKNGNIYFNSDRIGGKGSMDIYVSHLVNGIYQKPSNIATINSVHSENDLCVDPEERFIIFNRYIDTTKNIDLYISYREDNDWSVPKPLNKVNHPTKWELTPSLSPDGSYFFYEIEGKIMQITTTEIQNIN